MGNTQFVYVDLGARQGDTILWYLRHRPHERPVSIYAWEVEPRSLGLLRREIQKQRPALRASNSSIELVEKAAWVTNGTTRFLRDVRTDQRTNHSKLSGGSLLANPFNDASATITVETVDFSKWVLAHTTVVDRITLKMDIEGAEFTLLEKMAADGSISRVHTLIVEIHEWFFSHAAGGLAPGAARYSGTSMLWRRVKQRLDVVAPHLRIVMWH